MQAGSSAQQEHCRTLSVQPPLALSACQSKSQLSQPPAMQREPTADTDNRYPQQAQHPAGSRSNTHLLLAQQVEGNPEGQQLVHDDAK